MKRSTIFDVAKLAGVSIKTVSRVVNHEPNVREATKIKVEKAITQLQYRPDQSARNLASHRSHMIGLVYDDPSAYEIPSSGYVMRLQQGALAACRAANFELLIHPCNYRKRQVNAELTSLIEHARPAGIILAAPLSNMPKIVRAIEATGTPLVQLSPGNGGGKRLSVVTGDRDASAEMTRYLASLGHKTIAFIKGHPSHKAVANRFLGYCEGLEEGNLKFSDRLVADGDNSFGSGEACAEKLLKLKNRPTAIFAANDDMAVGVMRAASRLGIKVPAQLSVAGFDDIALARQINPTLTTVRQPLTDMAELAAEALIKGKNGSESKSSVQHIPAALKLRDSTGPAPAQA